LNAGRPPAPPRDCDEGVGWESRSNSTTHTLNISSGSARRYLVRYFTTWPSNSRLYSADDHGTITATDRAWVVGTLSLLFTAAVSVVAASAAASAATDRSVSHDDGDTACDPRVRTRTCRRERITEPIPAALRVGGAVLEGTREETVEAVVGGSPRVRVGSEAPPRE